MNLGIVLNRVSFEEKQIILACKELGINVEQIKNEELFLQLNAEKDPQIKSDVLLQRSLSTIRAIYSTAILETKGYKVVNNYNAVSISADKLLTTLLLEKHKIPSPKTFVGFTGEAVMASAEKYLNYPMVTKPIIGSWGRMVAKIESNNHLSSIVESKEVMGDLFQKIHYFQEFIDAPKLNPNNPADIRVFYLGGECIAAMGRYRPENDFRSNIALGGKAKMLDIDSEMSSICKKIAEAIQGEILGIDLMITEKGYVCIEVNGVPGFEGITNATGINIGMKIAEYLKNKYL
jgi:[lysine-biosynthesis-protein LysW]--L-2-aminoadipate ligase